MDVPLILVALGGLLVLVGFAGGGIKTKWVEVPSPIGKGIRFSSVILGVLCIGGGGLLFHSGGGSRKDAAKAEATGGAASPVAKGSGAPVRGGPQAVELEVMGRVIDIFGNPREGVVVLVRGVQRYGISDEKGRFLLSGLPVGGGLTLEAMYGDERDSVSLDFEPGGTPGRVSLSEPFVLNPVTVDAVLCRYVEQGPEGLEAVGIFGGEAPRVPFDSLIPADDGLCDVWCFVRVFGPDRYEVDRNTALTYEWDWEGEPQGKPYAQSAGVRSFGWRTRASKRVWKGQWTLRVRAEHAELARISFEVF